MNIEYNEYIFNKLVIFYCLKKRKKCFFFSNLKLNLFTFDNS